MALPELLGPGLWLLRQMELVALVVVELCEGREAADGLLGQVGAVVGEVLLGASEAIVHLQGRVEGRWWCLRDHSEREAPVPRSE